MTVSDVVLTCTQAGCGGEATEDAGQGTTAQVDGVTTKTTQVFACPCGSLRINRETTDLHVTLSVMQVTTDPA